jgi:hypothetical protein
MLNCSIRVKIAKNFKCGVIIQYETTSEKSAFSISIIEIVTEKPEFKTDLQEAIKSDYQLKW